MKKELNLELGNTTKENKDIFDLKNIKGMGDSRVKLFNKLGIFNILELIETYPKDYQDRAKLNTFSDLLTCDSVQILVKCVGNVESRYIRKNMTIQNVLLDFESNRIRATWFNSPYVKTQLKIGENYIFFGKVKKDKYGIILQQPEFMEVNKFIKNSDNILPMYSLTKGLSQNVFRMIQKQAIEYIKNEKIEFNMDIPKSLLNKYSIPKKIDVIKQIHFPKSFEWKEKAREILAYEELFRTQLALLKLKEDNMVIDGVSLKNVDYTEILNKLKFELTDAQKTALFEIDKDLSSNKAMNRLLEGDVGSGKTIVSILAAYKAVKSSYQVVVMAPTAILANQHLESFKELLPEFRIEILQSSNTKKEKRIIKEKLANGDIDILIATHAVLEDDVVFKNLGLCITDEQHRFGVAQREKIIAKGKGVNVLVMSATPIPRTLGLILYGDLDISIIDKMPPGRKEIKTQYTNYSKEKQIEQFIELELKKGRQAYVVCPLIENAKSGDEDKDYCEDDTELNSVLKVFENYNERFKNFKVEYLHGKMKQAQKDEIMEKFQKNEIHILISTTVIEVGINVPNATIMIVENAERFGLAQLHQLRGRIGRGTHQSYCLLKLNSSSKIAIRRATIMASTNNGFEIAEKDLELRGMGDFFGTMQHGIPQFKLANLFNDTKLLKLAQKDAKEIIRKDPSLSTEENIGLRKIINSIFSKVL